MLPTQKTLALIAGAFCAPFVLLHLIYRFIASPRKATFFTAAKRASQSSARLPTIGGARRITLEVNDNLVHGFAAGDPSAPLMLCLHGFPESAYSFRHVLTGLSDRYYVIAIDMPGYGGTTKAQPSWWASDDYAVPRVVQQVVGVMRALGRERIDVLVGHDWGAVIAWAVAGAHPDRVGRLIAMNVPHPSCFRRNAGWRQALRSLYILFFQLPWLPELYLSADDFAFLHSAFLGKPQYGGVSRREYMSHDDVNAVKWTLTRAGSLTAALNYYRALFSPDTLEFERAGRVAGTRRNKLPMPVLHLWGTGDVFLGEELTEHTQDYCADYTLVKMSGCSHWIQNDHVPETLQAVRRWLEGVTS